MWNAYISVNDTLISRAHFQSRDRVCILLGYVIVQKLFPRYIFLFRLLKKVE